MREQLRLPLEPEVPSGWVAWEVPIDGHFPVEAANRLGTVEAFNKHLYRPNTYLHKWWARRCGSTFRYVLKGLVLDPSRSDYYAPGGLEGRVVLDPMMGGGTILHEAIRMGASVVGSDIDPIPVLQARASLALRSIPRANQVFSDFVSGLNARIGSLFATVCPECRADSEVQFTLYGLRKRCGCREVLSVDGLVLRYDKNGDVRICAKCREVHRGTGHECDWPTKTLVERLSEACELCGQEFRELRELRFAERYQPVAVVGWCRVHGQFFKTADRLDFANIEGAKRQMGSLSFGEVERFVVRGGPKSDDLLSRGVTSYLELFSPRQLLYLDEAIKRLGALDIEDRIWLGLLVSTSLEFNSMLCGYKGGDPKRPGAVRHVFSHHAYSFPYTALENNPLFSGGGSGTLRRLFRDRILKAGEWARAPVETRLGRRGADKVVVQGEIDGGEEVGSWGQLRTGERKFMVVQADSSGLEIPKGIVDFVVTDPPYLDNVQYSDLSSFFRVWLERLVPEGAEWDYDHARSAVSEGGSESARNFGEVLEGIWRRCAEALNREHGRLIFTYHHWRSEAWAELTISLKRAGFELVNRYVVFSENPISVHIRGLKALKHDAVLVLRPAGHGGKRAEWPAPARIVGEDSYKFCSDCAAAVGWFLANDVDDERTRAMWAGLLGEGRNGASAV